jgi:raffinose/stachyose/melibiose transport system permease protein
MTRRTELLITYVVLGIFSFFAIYPIFSIFLLSLNRPNTLVIGTTIPHPFSLESYVKAWTESGFSRSMANSLFVAVAVVVLAIIFSLMTSYALGKMNFPGRGLVYSYFLIGIIVPYQATIIPLYYQFRALNLINTYWAFILPQTAFSIAFGTFWLRAFFLTFPDELIDAGRVDGANPWTMLWRVIVPNATPAILAIAAILFIWTWNDLFIAIVMGQSEQMTLAPASLAFFAGTVKGEDLPVIAAAAILVALPVVIIYIFLQRQYIEGIVAGSINK